jgi:tetratricopeptide (TPR) repeat protein
MVLNLIFFCKRSLPVIFLILLTGIVVYANSFQVPFVFDDHWTIVNNAIIKNLDNFFANSSGYDFLPNRYVATLSLAINYFFGGLDVTGYHAVNLFIHLLSALLVYTLLRLTFQTPYFEAQKKSEKAALADEPDSGSTSPSTWFSSFFTPDLFIPLFAALLFVVHPVQTQAVTYIVQRMTSLTTMLFLLSCVLYVLARLRFEERGSRGVKRGRMLVLAVPVLQIVGAVLAAVLAMNTKEIAFTLPFAALLYEVCFFRGAWKQRLLYLLPLIATLPIIPIAVLGSGGVAEDILADVGKQLPVGDGVSWQVYLLTQFRVVVTYLRLLIFPVNQNLDYDYPAYSSFLTPPVFLSFLLLATIFGLAVYLFWHTRYRRGLQVESKSGSGLTSTLACYQPTSPSPYQRLIPFGIFWFFLTLSVESSFVPLKDVIMEHRLYLPGVGAATVFATAFCLVAVKLSRPAYAKFFISVAVLMVMGLGFVTIQRNYVWGDAIRLWQDVVAKSPNKGRSHNNLGVALEDAGRRAEAIETLSRAIDLDPGYYRSYYNLGDLYLVSDQPRMALPLLQTAIQLEPTFTDAYVGVGAALMRSGRFSDVIIFLEQNLAHVKDNAEAHFYLGASYAFQGDRKAALRELTIVSQRDPELAATLRGMLR